MKAIPSHAQPRTRKLVLLVDDCSESREMYAEYLGGEFDIAEAADGLGAIDTTVALRPDVVVLDLTLPGLSGLEAARRLRRDPLTHDIPLLVVSGHSEPDWNPTDGPPPWVAFLVKPCLPVELAAAIRCAVARSVTPIASPDCATLNTP